MIFKGTMKTFVIMGKGTIIVPVDILSETASNEIKSMLEQDFKILVDELKASSTSEALKVYERKSKFTTFPSKQILGIKVSASSSIDNEVGEYKGAVFSEQIEILNAMTLAGSNNILSKLRSTVVRDLKVQACSLGANSILDISININTGIGHLGFLSTFGGSSKGDVLACVSAYGTASYISKPPVPNKS